MKVKCPKCGHEFEIEGILIKAPKVKPDMGGIAIIPKEFYEIHGSTLEYLGKDEEMKENYDPNCPLCKAEKLTKWYYEDDIIYICDCLSHPDKKLIVLKRHTPTPTEEEYNHMISIAKKLFPDKKWREPASIKDHYHLHEI